nr:helix-turn-helix domain-containing protein [Marinicella sp. W31]MDC2875878.1 helix-turn-helix domain-containing protein [Marinicella sp. W31]
MQAKSAAEQEPRQSWEVYDAAQQAALQPWIDMECFQLTGGKPVSTMDTLALGCQTVVRERQHAAVQKLGATPTNLCTLSYCTPAPGFRFSEYGHGHADTVFFMPERTEFDLFVPKGAQTVYIRFDQDSFAEAARILEPQHWEQAPSQVRAWQTKLKPAFAALIEMCLAKTDKTTGQTGEIKRMHQLLLQAALEIAATSERPHQDSAPRPALSRAVSLCRRTRNFAKDCLDADTLPTMVDLCAHTGVSARTLQYAFNDYIGMSPNAYLRSLRLNRARNALTVACGDETTVTRVAMQFGFLHLGRFSQDYGNAFGEPPSATLAGRSLN